MPCSWSDQIPVLFSVWSASIKTTMAITIALGIGVFQGGEMMGFVGKTTDGAKVHFILTTDCGQIPVFSTKTAILAAMGGNPLTVIVAAWIRTPKRRVIPS